MFDIYLPIADVHVDLLHLIIIGLVTGVLSGLFGLGGGIVSVPYLTLIGIPPHVAVATATNQMTAGTLSSCIAYAKMNRVDFKLGLTMLAGGVVGNLLALILYTYIQKFSDLDTFISICFFVLLSVIGTKTLFEAVTSIYKHFRRVPHKPKRTRHAHWFYIMPFRIKYKCAEERISVFLPALVGMVGGFFVLMLGIGGGFIMIPAMLYFLKINEHFLSGTIQFQIIFTSIFSTVLHTISLENLDIILAAILIFGTVIGAQIGAALGMRIDPKRFRLLLAFIILAIALTIGAELLLEPSNLYKIDQVGK